MARILARRSSVQILLSIRASRAGAFTNINTPSPASRYICSSAQTTFTSRGCSGDTLKSMEAQVSSPRSNARVSRLHLIGGVSRSHCTGDVNSMYTIVVRTARLSHHDQCLIQCSACTAISEEGRQRGNRNTSSANRTSVVVNTFAYGPSLHS